MNELLNKYGLSDDFGFVIFLDMLRQLFDSEEDYLKLKNTIIERMENIKNNYRINSINLAFNSSIAVQSVNGSKTIVLSKESLLNSIEEYFTYGISTPLFERKTVLFDEKEEKQWLEEKIASVRELLTKGINELKNVETIDDLKGISNQLYNAYLDAKNEKKDNNSYTIPWNLWFSNELKKDIEALGRIKLWLPNLIDELSKKTISKDLFDNINIDKFKLFLVHQYIQLANDLDEPYKSLLNHNAIEIFNSIQNKEISLNEIILLTYDAEKEKHVFVNTGYSSYDQIRKAIDDYLADPIGSTIFNTIKSYKTDNKDISDYNKVYNDLVNLINMAITKSNEMGLEDVSLQNVCNDAKEKLKIEKSVEKQNQLKSFIDRAEFYKKEPNIYKVQKGNGIFSNSYVIYFNNGVVAIDKLNGNYGYLYLMPISVYFEIISNNTIKNLTEIRSIITVTPISHKKINWKEIAHNEIQMHALRPDELEMLQSIEGISLPVNDIDLEKAKERYRNNEFIYKKILAKEQERKNKYKEIDDEQKAKDYTGYEGSQEALDEYYLKDAEEEIAKNVSNSSDLVSIYDYETKTKTTRNPKVSLNTKLRTLGEKGEMRCEMCDDYESIDTRNFETHHIIPLSEGGIDNVYNTVCLCGNCHNKMHSRIPFTYEQKWKMLMNVRKNIERTTPYYLENFDRLFNPSYNELYNKSSSEEEQLKKYEEEKKYYNENKKEEDERFLTEYNCFKK